MKQPTKKEITQNVKMFLDGKKNREDVCSWAINFIRNDEGIGVTRDFPEGDGKESVFERE